LQAQLLALGTSQVTLPITVTLTLTIRGIRGLHLLDTYVCTSTVAQSVQFIYVMANRKNFARSVIHEPSERYEHGDVAWLGLHPIPIPSRELWIVCPRKPKTEEENA